MSNFSTGTSSTALCTHLSAIDFWLAFVMQSGAWSMSSCPLRPLWINKYLSWVATHSRYKSVPCDPDKNTQACCITTVLEHPGQHSHGIWTHCRFTCSLPMQTKRTVKFWSHHIARKQRFLGVLWKEIVLVPQASKGKWAKGIWQGAVPHHEMPTGHTGLPPAWVCLSDLQCVDLLHIVNANIYEQKEEFSCHSGSYWGERRRGDTKINTVPPKKASLRDKASVRQREGYI